MRIFILFTMSVILISFLLTSVCVRSSVSIFYNEHIEYNNENMIYQLQTGATQPSEFRQSYSPNLRYRHHPPDRVPRMHDPHRWHGYWFVCNSVYPPAAQSHHDTGNKMIPLCWSTIDRTVFRWCTHWFHLRNICRCNHSGICTCPAWCSGRHSGMLICILLIDGGGKIR